MQNPSANTNPIKTHGVTVTNAVITNEAEYAELVKAQELRAAELKKGQNGKEKYKNGELKKDVGSSAGTFKLNGRKGGLDKKDEKTITETPDSGENKIP